MVMSIVGTGSCVGEIEIDNYRMFELDRGFDLEKAKESLAKKDFPVEGRSKLEIYDAHVQAMSGIKKRHFTNKTAEYLGAEASMIALEEGGMSSNDLDFIIACSFTEHKKIPNIALTIADLIGNPGLPGITPNEACAGFIHGLEDAYLRILSGNYQRILVVSTEKLSEYTDFSDYKTPFLFGDGAGAAVVEANPGGMTSIPYVGAEHSSEHITVESKGLIEMGGGPRVLARAVRAMENSLVMALLYDKHGKPAIDQNPGMLERTIKNRELLRHYCKNIDWVVPHPANLRIFQNLQEKFLDIIEPEKFLENIILEGNISGASLPRILDLNIRNGNIERGDVVCLTAVGGGYTFGGAVFRY